MFTGIIYKTSEVLKSENTRGGMSVSVENKLSRAKVGESVLINGVCSTIVKKGKSLDFEFMPETLKLTNVKYLKRGDIVNIEESMRVGDSISGHIVLGHIDDTGKILSIKKEGNSKTFKIKINSKYKKFIVKKGCIAVEGVSLTVTNVATNFFVVKIIPHTLQNTNLGQKKEGDAVNLEFDILAKYASQK